MAFAGLSVWNGFCGSLPDSFYPHTLPRGRIPKRLSPAFPPNESIRDESMAPFPNCPFATDAADGL